MPPQEWPRIEKAPPWLSTSWIGADALAAVASPNPMSAAAALLRTNLRAMLCPPCGCVAVATVSGALAPTARRTRPARITQVSPMTRRAAKYHAREEPK